VKSVIDIDVNDGAFQRFSELFAKYQDQLKKTPDAWKKVSDEVETTISKTTEGVEGVGDATEKVNVAAAATSVLFHQTFVHVNNQAAAVGTIAKNQTAVTRAASAQSNHWKDMARNAKTFAGHIGDATRSILRWSALTGVFTGLLGAGGLFGIDRLAHNAGNSRRNSLGLGVSVGEEKAFGLNYGRVVDPASFLGGVNESLHDVTKRVGLYGAGLTEKDLAGKDTAGVAAELIPALKKIADQTPEAMMAQVLKARYLDQFVTLEEFQSLKNTPASEVAQYGRQYQADSKSLDLNQDMLKKWQDFQVQLHRAGEQIETTFIKGLTPLAEPLGHLSEAFTKTLESLLAAPKLKEWIEDLAVGIKKFGDYLLTDKFQEDVKNFVVKVGDFVTGIENFVTAISNGTKFITDLFTGKTQGVNGPLTDDNPNAPGSPAFYAAHPEIKRPDWSLGGGSAPEYKDPDFKPPPDTWYNPMTWHWNLRKDYNKFAGLEGASRLPEGLLNAVEKQESSGDGNAISKAGAQGYFQFMPDTAKRYGVDVHDEASSATGAAQYITDLRKQFGGSLVKALAAYNWGEDNLQKDIDKYGADWRSHLPKETEDYLAKILPKIQMAPPPAGKGGNVSISIQNNTGGNAVVSASQLPS
jgi:hypothetical protein